ncbi:GreA/GreB family elongation factor [Nocardioides sp. R-C-SC26]|uniref:GreA/GreB family elongation factor n=1 Tax=Nocardioides sp. R-C-SC26 TaxID=2870414 RepID=UPI001E4E6C11|nr:GreA/GreB family elongation factor [Nocardioides sp. R-C-SC26]
MTLTAAAPVRTTADDARTDLLAHRLVGLKAERDQVLAESVRTNAGDVADRATNVEATIRLAMLDERIAALELDIEAVRRAGHTDGVVSLGDTVTLDLGDGPETFVIGSVEQAVVGVDTVTPSSPLGRAILGAPVGSTVSYSPRRGLELTATVVAA